MLLVIIKHTLGRIWCLLRAPPLGKPCYSQTFLSECSPLSSLSKLSLFLFCIELEMGLVSVYFQMDGPKDSPLPSSSPLEPVTIHIVFELLSFILYLLTVDGKRLLTQLFRHTCYGSKNILIISNL